MKTTITENEIVLHVKPFSLKEYRWENIEKADIIDFKSAAIWGFGKYTKHGVLYAIGGNLGFQFKHKSEQLVIGTRKPKELRSSIAHLLK